MSNPPVAYDRTAPPPRHMRLDCGGVRIHVEERGAGEPALLLLHYWGGSTRTWRHVTERLAATHRTVAMDHRGWGDSDAPDDGYALADLAADAMGVIAAMGRTRYVLVGHSMGGKVAQLLASRRPAGLVGLVLVDSAPPGPMAVPIEQRRGMVDAYASRAGIERTLDEVLTAGPLGAEDRAQVVEDSLRGALEAKAAWPLSSSQEDIRPEVERIAAPTLVVVGEQDKVDTVETTRAELVSHIAGARIVVLPDCGHLSPLEAPEALARLIGRFTAGLDLSEAEQGAG